MKTFKPSGITAALLASGLSVLSLPIIAQEAETEEPAASEEELVERIEVRGFGTSLIQSLNQKRFGDTVSEQLTADDLGALPDVSMADALTRLPGISAVRTGGQAAEINIRGLAGDFVFSTLNGREQVSTSGDRSIEFDQYPSELITSAAVYKSPKASLIEGGVAGTVELATASPLSIDEQHKFNVNLRGAFNDRADEIPDAEEWGHRVSFSYQGKYLDDTLGVALGYARLFQPSVSTQFVGFDFSEVAGSTPISESCPDCQFVSNGFELQHRGGEETRDGYVGAIEWAPTDNFVLKADAFVSRFDSEAFARGYRVILNRNDSNIVNPRVFNGNVIGGFFAREDEAGALVQITNDDNTEVDTVESYGINAEWQATDDLTLSFDIALSRAESDFRNGLLWALPVDDANSDSPSYNESISLAYQLNGLDLPGVAFSQANTFTNPDNVLVTQYGIYPFETKDELDAYKFDLEYQLDNDFVRSIEFGYRYSDREYNNDRRAFQYGDANNVSSEEGPLRLTPDMFEVVDFSGDFAAYPSYLSIDLDAALNAWFPNGVPQPAQTWLPSGNFNRDWTMRESGDVFETVNAAYLMANLDFELLDIPVTGNIGVRYVDTKQASTALQPASMIGEFINEDGEIETGPVPDLAAGAQPIVDELGGVNTLLRPAIIEHNYDDWLPSLNLNFQITDNQQIRFAYAKVMGRAPINRFAANASSNVELPSAQQNVDSGVISLSRPTALFNANSNNSPFLEPFYATQYDLSYEYYFEDTDGALIAALFYKDIESFIQEDRQNPFDFAANGFTVPSEVNVPVVYDNRSGDLAGEPVLDANGDQVEILVPIENGEYVTAFNNDEGGYIRGIELAYTQIYSFLPGMWSGLGVSASYSYTESEIQRVTGNGVFSQNLPGLSENVATVTLFWEYEDFETRISTRYRDDFVSEQVGIGTQTVNFDSEVVVDYQASYNYDENTTVLFQIVNLTDEPTRSFFNTQEQTGTIQYFGTQYFLGVSYTL